MNELVSRDGGRSLMKFPLGWARSPEELAAWWRDAMGVGDPER